jgi:hypothetical protein
MACYILGRQLGLVSRAGPLGKLAARISPNGLILALGDAVMEAGAGRLEEAAGRIAGLPIKGTRAVLERDEAAKAMRSLAALRDRRARPQTPN